MSVKKCVSVCMCEEECVCVCVRVRERARFRSPVMCLFSAAILFHVSWRVCGCDC